MALDICASTNDECLSAAKAGDAGNLWVTARHQTGAKGSRGRQWESREGNLFASLLLVNPCAAKHLPELTFLASLAVHETLAEILPNKEIHVKWPNDVLVEGRKISGILLESSIAADRIAVVIGIGINCHHNPAETRHPATNIAAMGVAVEPERVFAILARKLAAQIAFWQAGCNFDKTCKKWLNHAWGIGKQIDINLYDGAQVSGIFKGLDAAGRLELLRNDGRMQRISVGEIFTLPTEQEK